MGLSEFTFAISTNFMSLTGLLNLALIKYLFTF